MENKETRTNGIKWSIQDIQNQQSQTRVTTSAVTVISDHDRIREISRIEMDRILFWND